MFSIDFSTLPNISKRLNQDEINNLNVLFRDPSIQEKLEEIEAQRKKRQKWKWGILVGCFLISIGLALLLGKGNILEGILYQIGTDNESFSPVLWTVIGTYGIGMTTLYAKFASKIEIPLKSKVLGKMCPLLSPNLEYSHDTKYSFNDLNLLRTKGFLASYDTIDVAEDSIHCEVEKDAKAFSMNGFELKTSEIRGTGKNRRRVITNQCYLIRAVFPNARTPLANDLFIMQDRADRVISKGIILPLVVGLFGTIFVSAFSEKILFGLLAGIILAGAIYYTQRKGYNKKRVHLENMAFEKLFDVKCEDQVSSRIIITPAFMDRLVSFVNKTKGEYEFLLQNNIMYIKKLIKRGYLEAGTEKNMLTNLGGFTQFYTDMREIIQFVTDMNLLYLSKTDTSKRLENQNTDISTTPVTPEGTVARKGLKYIFKTMSPIELKLW